MTEGLEYSRLSPLGRGAISVIELRGEGRHRVLARLLGRAPGERVTHGVFRAHDGVVIDDGLCIPLEQSTLVSLHGNPVLVDRFLEALRDAGATETSGHFPLETTRLRREALDLITRVPTAGAAAALLFQSDEESAGLAGWRRNALAGTPINLESVQSIIEKGRLMSAVFDPPRVLLAGVPNAGKSTLFNYLLGQDRVVTHGVPGTTRDLIEEVVPVGDFPVRFLDGAGLRTAAESIEKEGIRRVRTAARESDLVVFLSPVPSVVPDQDSERIRDELRSVARCWIEVCSRCDEGQSPNGHGVSGVTGEGVPELEARVLDELFGTTSLPREPAGFVPRHEQILTELIERLDSGRDVVGLLEAL